MGAEGYSWRHAKESVVSTKKLGGCLKTLGGLRESGAGQFGWSSEVVRNILSKSKSESEG